jgi:hypothetical protein
VRALALVFLLGCAGAPEPKQRPPERPRPAAPAPVPRDLPRPLQGNPFFDPQALPEEELNEVPPEIPLVDEPPLDELPDGPEVPELEDAREAEELGKYDKARDAAKAAMQGAELDVVLAALALQGRVGVKLGKGANAAYNGVLDAYRDAGEPPASEVVLDALGEALTYFAELKRQMLPAAPRYQGSGAARDVQQFINRDVRSWVDTYRQDGEEAERAYLEVMKLSPAPPPRWAVVSSLRVGAMWATFAHDLREAPYPTDWDQPGFVPGVAPPTTWAELKKGFQLDLALTSQPEIRRARQAFQGCVTFADKHRIKGPHKKACARWLEKNPR